MFEDIIMELDAMGVAFDETEEGEIIIGVVDMDKVELVDIISMLNAMDADYTIDSEEIVVSGGEPVEEEMPEDEMDSGMPDMGDMGDLPPMF